MCNNHVPWQWKEPPKHANKSGRNHLQRKASSDTLNLEDDSEHIQSKVVKCSLICFHIGRLHFSYDMYS